MPRIYIRRHLRKRKPVRAHIRRVKRPTKIGTIWKGEHYIHGPRKRKPSRYSEFRLGKPTKTGKRIVWGKNKKTGRWEIQSTLMPRKVNKNG